MLWFGVPIEFVGQNKLVSLQLGDLFLAGGDDRNVVCFDNAIQYSIQLLIQPCDVAFDGCLDGICLFQTLRSRIGEHGLYKSNQAF